MAISTLVMEKITEETRVIPGVDAEYDQPLDVIVCEPSEEMFFAALRAKGALYEGSFALEEAQREHKIMVDAVKSTGANVYDLKELMLTGLHDDFGNETERMAMLRELTFHTLHNNYDREIGLEDRIQSEIDRKVDLSQMSPECMLKFLLIQPLTNVKYNGEGNADTGNEISVEPVYNITFMRDQMITTPKGIVLGKMNSRQRRTETLLVKFGLGGLGVEPILEIEGAGRLEGGDYLPTADTISLGDGTAGDVVYLGNGLRTNEEAVDQLLDNYATVFGDKILAVVTDPKSDQDHMHLDTYMNILGEKQVLIDESRFDAKEKNMPKVTLYKAGPDGKGYPVDHADGRESMPIKEYFAAQGYRVVRVSSEMQAAYGVNFLTVGPQEFIGVDIEAKQGFKQDLAENYVKNAGVLAGFFKPPSIPNYAELASDYKMRLDKGGVTNTTFLPFNNLNQAYGSIHCMTQVIRRDKPVNKQVA
ncbi:hypothetical protein GOV07_03770 [Candidatus Woesearchaeota archaeon]|nr:hypothetical protein [Candidatus Woesearchaeota archaeon]